MWAIPKDAPHPRNAHLFLNCILRPEVIADATNFINHANANSAATELVLDEIRNNPAIYPPAELRAKLYPNPMHSTEYNRLLNRYWTRIETGK